MEKSNSFNKREVEKNKRQKRKEKKKRREERKNSAPNSFEDMIAYVDENGVITSTAPDPEEKTIIDAEDIIISTPKKTEEDEPTELIGRVEFFDESRGFGFIKDRESVNKYFFHKSNVAFDIKENNIVTFNLEPGPKGMNAVAVELAKK